MKEKIRIVALSFIFLSVVIFLLFSNKIHYDSVWRIEPESLLDNDYIKLEPGVTVTQAIDFIDDVGLLKNIEIILINLSEETEGADLNVKICRNGKAVKETEHFITQDEAGEWTSIPINQTLRGGGMSWNLVCGIMI